LEQGINKTGTAELSYLGDAVFELMVREKLLNDGVPFRQISKQASKLVSAGAQAEMYHKIYEALTLEEQAVLKRGRNLHNLSRAKNAGVSQYRHATGLEALFGWLRRSNSHQRLEEIFNICVSTETKTNGDSANEK